MIKYSCIIPVYKDKKIAENAILSLAKQYRPTKEEHKPFADWTIECVIVNDSPDTDMSSLKDLFDEHKACEDWTCKYVVMPSNQGEGNARKLGIKESTGEYFFLMDCDDFYGPDCFNKVNEIILEETKKGNKISMVEYPFTSFDVHYINPIASYSIWVQSKCYNKAFVQNHNIESTDLSSRAGADYCFISQLHGIQDYYDRTFRKEADKNPNAKPEWVRVVVKEEPSFTWAYWYPSNSQTRKCNYWGTWINCKTVLNGLYVFKYLRDFETKHGEAEERREFYKADALNKACYNFINLHDFLRCCATNPDWEKKVTGIDEISGEDNNVVMYDLFKKAYLGTSELLREFIDEIWDMTIWTSFEAVWNRSDCHKCMPWFDFRTYIEDPSKLGVFDFKDMKELIAFCKKNYSFDANGFPLHAEQYKKFIEVMESKKHGNITEK